MSTPYVSGAAALVVSEFGYSGSHIRQLLLESAVSHEKLKGKVDGGRLDVMNLIRMAESAYNFWFVADGDRTATLRVTVPAKNSTSVRLQLGSVGLSAGIHQAQVNVSWLGGETRIPVTYTVQGQPRLQLLQSSVDWPQVPVNASSDRLLTFANIGNGSARVRLQRLPYPFAGEEREVVIPAAGSASVQIHCAPKTTGEWFGHGLFNTNSGLDAWASTQLQAADLGTVFNASLTCVSKKDPYLELERISGAAEVLRHPKVELRFFEHAVHAEWEPFLKGEEVEGDLVLPAADNSLGCSPYNTPVASSLVLVARGECFFSEKARMAQEANASGVLLYDNQAETTLPIVAMPRDGSIPHIPMFMVTKVQGEALLQRLERESIRIKMQWQAVRAYTLPGRSTRVGLNVSNHGDANLHWTARPSLSFGSHSFYESYFPESDNGLSEPQFSWTSPGKELSFFSSHHASDESLLQPLPFNFSFFGQMFDEVWISSKGFLAFDGEVNASRIALPFRAETAKPNGIVAGFGWNLLCRTCKISSSVTADEADRGDACFVVQYANLSFDSTAQNGAGDQISFEIRLCKDGQISFMYAQFPEPHTLYMDAFIGLETIDGAASVNLRSQLPFSVQRPFAVTLEPWLRAASATQGVLQKNETVKLVYDVRSNIGHSGLVHVKAQDDSGLWRSQQDVRIVQDRFHFTVAGGDWGVCLVEDCGNLGAGVRRRPLRCAGMDGRSYDWDTFCRNPLASCSDLKSEWRDKDGARCQEYEEKSWCNADGSYGSGWRSSWGAFSDYSFGGADVSTICCACGGGVRSPPPATVTGCNQNLAAIDMDCDGTIDCSDACPLDPQPQCTTMTTSTAPPEGATSEEVTTSITGLTNFSSRLTTSTAPPSTVTLAALQAEATLPCWAFAPTTGIATTSCPGCVVMLGTTLDRNVSDESSVIDTAGCQGVACSWVLLAMVCVWFGVAK